MIIAVELIFTVDREQHGSEMGFDASHLLTISEEVAYYSLIKNTFVSFITSKVLVLERLTAISN